MQNVNRNAEQPLGRKGVALSTLHSFAAVKAAEGVEVRIPRASFEKAVPAIFRTDEILEAAGARLTKTHVVAPLSAWRFLRDDKDAAQYATTLKVDLRQKPVTVRNTDLLRSKTLPWCGPKASTGYANLYAEGLDKGLVPDALTLAMVRPARKASKAKSTAKAAATTAAAAATPKAESTPPRQRGGRSADVAARARQARERKPAEA